MSDKENQAYEIGQNNALAAWDEYTSGAMDRDEAYHSYLENATDTAADKGLPYEDTYCGFLDAWEDLENPNG